MIVRTRKRREINLNSTVYQPYLILPFSEVFLSQIQNANSTQRVILNGESNDLSIVTNEIDFRTVDTMPLHLHIQLHPY